jgi:hypothetical protein
VLADTDELTSKLTAAVTQHRPEQGSDTFEKPDELDPLARDDFAEGDETELAAEVEETSEVDAEAAVEVDEESEQQART